MTECVIYCLGEIKKGRELTWGHQAQWNWSWSEERVLAVVGCHRRPSWEHTGSFWGKN